MVLISYKIFEKIESDGKISYKKLEESEYHEDQKFPFAKINAKINEMILNKIKKDELELAPEDAFGLRSEDKIVEYPIDMFDDSIEKDNILLIKDQANNIALAKVIEVQDKAVKFDLNHPYAGKHVKFEIEIVNI